MNKRYLALGCFAISLSLLTGCANQDKKAVYDSKEAKTIYDEAVEKINKGRYQHANDDLEAIESRYPFGDIAERAHLAMIWSYYKSEEYAQAVAACDRFISLYPRHPHVDYAYYMRGMVHFFEAHGFTDRFLPMKRSQRDIQPAEQAFTSFGELINRFPKSRYVGNARARMIYLREMIADHHLGIASYYVERRAYVAAINRASIVVNQFDQTPAVRDALILLRDSYKALGLDDNMNDIIKIQKANQFS